MSRLWSLWDHVGDKLGYGTACTTAGIEIEPVIEKQRWVQHRNDELRRIRQNNTAGQMGHVATMRAPKTPADNRHSPMRSTKA